MNTSEYLSIIENIKSEIKAAQYRAAVHANVDMLLLYHDIGCVINEHKSWGNKFIDNLATDIRIAFPKRSIFQTAENRICIANDRFKMKAILGALRGGLCNVLITNSKIARHLLTLDSESGLERPT